MKNFVCSLLAFSDPRVLGVDGILTVGVSLSLLTNSMKSVDWNGKTKLQQYL